jgi:hypothetical protein
MELVQTSAITKVDHKITLRDLRISYSIYDIGSSIQRRNIDQPQICLDLQYLALRLHSVFSRSIYCAQTEKGATRGIFSSSQSRECYCIHFGIGKEKTKCLSILYLLI